MMVLHGKVENNIGFVLWRGALSILSFFGGYS
jgi:hypothetical protein